MSGLGLAAPSTRQGVIEELRRHAADPLLMPRAEGMLERVPDVRSRVRISRDEDLEVWLMTWPADTRTGWHDHGLVSGAYVVLTGSLTECRWDGGVHARTLPAGSGRRFGPNHVHDLVNTTGAPAVSVHAYTPRLRTMTRFELEAGHLQVTASERVDQS